jgi:hypothetical protein
LGFVIPSSLGIRHFATASPLFLLADQAPIFFHQVNVGYGKA